MYHKLIRRLAVATMGTPYMILAMGGCPPTTTGTTPGGSSGTGTTADATLLEQLSLELINRARLKPGDEATMNSIALNEGPPSVTLTTTAKQPLAMNSALTTAARNHSTDMLSQNYFAHNSPGGSTPSSRIAAAGYTAMTSGENIAQNGTSGTLNEAQSVVQQHTSLFVDAGIAGRGHRVNMLNNAFREIGIGIARGNFTSGGSTFDTLMQTQDSGATSANTTFVLGVVYTDTNGNGAYDFGEGTASSTVTLGGTSKTTNAAGGYSFEVTVPNTYTLSFAAGPSQTVTIAAGGPNIKVDLVGGAMLVVNLGLGPLP
ncbi:MAG: CAP domain-containing protein [Phycisphaerae bacterium]